MSTVKTLFLQSLHYFAGNFLLLIASFISFPILTRILTVGDYGILSYVSSLTVLLVGLSKLGLQHSAIRYYSEFKEKLNNIMDQFYSTLYLVPVILGAMVAFVVLAILILGNHMFDKRLTGFIGIAAIGIPLQSGVNIFSQFLRAEQRIRFFNVLNIISRYGSLSLGVALVLLVTGDVWGLYYAGLIFGAAFFLYSTSYLYLRKGLSPKYVSISFLKRALAYGTPLVGYEFCAEILEYGDRILLKHFLTIEAVAIYSVGYNAPMYISELFGAPLRLAIVPLYMDIWEKKGEEATKEFLSKALSYFILIAIPIIFGVCAIKKEMIALLASNKFAWSQYIVPYIIVGTMLYNTNAILAAGLFIYKKTHWLAISLLAGAILNITLNFYLIPKMGLIGSALATLLAYIFVLLINAFVSFRYLSFPIDWKRIFVGLLCSAIMFMLVKEIAVGILVFDLILKVVVGILSYGLLLMLLDRKVRSDLVFQLQKLRKRLA